MRSSNAGGLVGASFVEALVALALLGGLLLGAAGLFDAAARSVRRGRDRSAALALGSTLADRAAERTRAELVRLSAPPCDASASDCRLEGATAPTGSALAGWQAEAAARLPRGRVAVELTALDGALADGGLLRVAIDLSWRDGTRRRGRRSIVVRP